MSAVPTTVNETSSSSRLIYLDCLRGIAVLLVIFQHLTEHSYASIDYIGSNYYQFGQAGVALFFLISGYIIPISLAAAPNLKVFWVHRIFRLFPIYWVSIFFALVLAYLGYFSLPKNIATSDVLINFTMLQGFAGIENVLGIYWSLKFEMVFYIAMTLLVMVKLIRRPLLVFVCYTSSLWLVAIIASQILNRPFPYGLFNLELMFTGWLIGSWNVGKISSKAIAIVLSMCSFTALLTAYLAFFNTVDRSGVGSQSFTPMVIAWISSLAVFFCSVLVQKSKYWPRWLALVGVISYSAYLIHTLVISTVKHLPIDSRTVALAVCLSLILLLSWASHRYLELSFIALGKKTVSKKMTTAKLA